MPVRPRGIIMVVTLLLMPICLMLGTIMLKTIIAEKHFLRHERTRGQSFYLAETGINAAYYSFSSSAFTGFTHLREASHPDQDDPGTPVTVSSLTISPLIAQRIPFQKVVQGPWTGWYEYTWTPKSQLASLTRTGLNESIRFRVTRTYDGAASGGSRPTSWEIVCVAQLAEVSKTHRLTGDLQGLTDFTIFDAGDCNEFIRGANQSILGKVHANGDMYLKPSGTVLTINTQTSPGEAGFTTAGRFWYGKDATGRTNMGTVRLSRSAPVDINWPSQLDSFSSDWALQSNSLWGGTVADQNLGCGAKGVPAIQSFEPDGFYATRAQSAGLCVRSDGGVVKVGQDSLGTGLLSDIVRPRSFYNHAEKRQVHAVEIDVSRLKASDYPNGLIYSEVPVVLVNAQKLPQKTSVVSRSGIYTLGDFNKELASRTDLSRRTDTSHPDYDPTHSTRVSAALMTRDRIWHLSKNATLPSSSSSGFKLAGNDPEEYPGDNTFVNRENLLGSANVIEVNAMLVDGAPLYDETWNRTVDAAGNIVPKFGPNNPDPAAQAASWDDLLESFGSSRALKKRGSIIHLQNGQLPSSLSLFNATSGSGTPPGQVAWYRQIAYDAPFRDYGYDARLKTDPPPFAPFAANRALWTDH